MTCARETLWCCATDAAARMGIERGYVGVGGCPSGIEPLVKPVVAVDGDVVDVLPSGLVVNGVPLLGTVQLRQDLGGRVLTGMSSGRYLVRSGQWVASNRDVLSWDSRYWGAVPLVNVLGRAHPIWVTP